MLTSNFLVERPATVEAALDMLAGGLRPLAGGTDLVPQLKEGRRSAPGVADLKRVPELREIRSRNNGGLSIGAAASATAVARHPDVMRFYPAVAASARLIGSWQVQNRASLGGNICNAAPSADAVPALVCHGARVVVAGANGRREMPLEALFTGPGRTVLAPGELLVSIELPPEPARTACHYLRLTPRREMDIAVAGVAARIEAHDDGSIATARLALASVAPTVIRAPLAEAGLAGRPMTAETAREAGRLAAEAARPISDTRASADYRRHLVAVLTERTLTACFETLARTGRDE